MPPRQDGGKDDHFSRYLPHISEAMYSAILCRRAILVNTDFVTGAVDV